MLTPCPVLILCPAQIQDLAIRCVQKNIKKNKGVKGWPWWKLFTTVRPLIEVQLTEDQIRGKDVGISMPGDAGWSRVGSGECWTRAGPPSGLGCRILQWGRMQDPHGGVGYRVLWWDGMQDHPTVAG